MTRGTMLSTLAWLAMLTMLATAAVAQNQGGGMQAELAVRGASYDNFFQSANPGDEADVTGGMARLRLLWPETLKHSVDLYADASYALYNSLDDSPGVRFGARRQGAAHAFDVFAETLLQRPTVDFDTDVESTDLLRVDALYSYRVDRDWELKAMADVHSQTFESTRGNDNTQVGLGAAVRYRGFGYRFSPEIGLAVADRDADSANQDMEQNEYWIKFRSAVTAKLYLTLRYRIRDREYPVSDPSESNFQRSDDRDNWTFTADLRTWDFLTWNLYYSREDADSTRPERIFTSSMLTLGVTTSF